MEVRVVWVLVHDDCDDCRDGIDPVDMKDVELLVEDSDSRFGCCDG